MKMLHLFIMHLNLIIYIKTVIYNTSVDQLILIFILSNKHIIF